MASRRLSIFPCKPSTSYKAGEFNLLSKYVTVLYNTFINEELSRLHSKQFHIRKFKNLPGKTIIYNEEGLAIRRSSAIVQNGDFSPHFYVTKKQKYIHSIY